MTCSVPEAECVIKQWALLHCRVWLVTALLNVIVIESILVLQSLVSDIHVVCGCLKDFLRGLKEPLVTFRLWNSFASVTGKRLLLLSICDKTSQLVHLTLVLSSAYDEHF